jgi:hypothetical protein
MDNMILYLAEEVCDGKKTLLQVERYLRHRGLSEPQIDVFVQLIRDKISERKKGNG